MRIVSLLPSLTEICFALGLRDDLVAVTHECDYPARARSLPFITRSILPPGLRDSAEIDRQVKAALSEGKALYELDAERLSTLRPDLILTQELCHVCAVSLDDVRAIASRIDPVPDVVSIEPHSVGEILESIEQVGALTNRSATANAVVEALRSRIEFLGSRVGPDSPRKRFVCLEWLDPTMVGGHWVPEMVHLAGGVDALGRAGEASFEVTWDDVVQAGPDRVVLMPCGFGLEDTIAETNRLVRSGSRLPAALGAIPAVRSGHVYAVDGSSYFSRPGPRLITGIEILAGILHEDLTLGVLSDYLAAPVQLTRAGVFQ